MKLDLRNAARSNPLARRAYARFVRYRGKWDDVVGRRLWASQPLESAARINRTLHDLIVSGEPFTAGKIGANEQNLLMWHYDVEIPTGIPAIHRRIAFDQTSNCAANAGIVPRTVESYRAFAGLLDAAVAQMRVLGVWLQPGEHRYLRERAYLAKEVCYFFDLEPFFVADPWTRALAGKKVLFVSPFTDSAIRQHPRMAAIWPNGTMPQFELLTYKFPYLFSQSVSSGLGWSDVYEDFRAKTNDLDFDVAIMGCGGLSLPLAEACRAMGRQAIHLGGAAQLLFGIRASRYEADPKYAALMNDAWVRPDILETPPEAQSIENGCYW